MTSERRTRKSGWLARAIGTGRREAGGDPPGLRRLVDCSGLPDRAIVPAERRLAYLRRFWDASLRAGYRNRRAVAERTVAEILAEDPEAEISVTSLWRWEWWFESDGPAGLIRQAHKQRRTQ